MGKFKLKSDFNPGGDQPEAIDHLTESIRAGSEHSVLLGVTGSGKTFSLANVIEKTQMPTLIISHNKTLAGQLYQEFRDFFPDSAVSYFVSYYDYYQPEAYIPQTDTYIEKETDINEEIDKLRLAATTNLLTRPDVIVVASVSCIYNLGSPVEYQMNMLELVKGELVEREAIMRRLIDLQYSRVRNDLVRSSFRVRADTIEVWPSDANEVLRVKFGEHSIESMIWLDKTDLNPLPDQLELKHVVVTPAKHFLADEGSKKDGFAQIRKDLQERLQAFKKDGKVVEAHRLEQKVNYDLEMIEAMGYVNGIENYSRYFDGRNPGDPPFTLLDYMRFNAEKFGDGKFLTVIDESHMTVPQVRGMYRGDEARKRMLIDYGFRLPSALDNRPLRFEEFSRRVPQVIYVSATPKEHEMTLAETSGGVAEQLIRPTGLIEPEIEVRPVEGQVVDVAREIIKRKKKGERVLVTTLTKKMAEELAEYLSDKKKLSKRLEEEVDEALKVHYLHSDVETLDRSDILDDLRSGEVDVIVGINLLREGLDLPEVSLVAILDADKEGFLRSDTSLIQTMGRAARHVEGKAILYADSTTGSMERAIKEIERRRKIQLEFNEKHGIDPKSIIKPIREKLLQREKKEDSPKKVTAELMEFGWETPDEIDAEALTPSDKKKLKRKLTQMMNMAAKDWRFEEAAKLRDTIERLG